MFDYYRPVSQLRCPASQRALREWQGKDGPNGLLVWVQGTAAPVDQLVDDEVQLPLAERQALGLPPQFVIYSYDCSEHQPIEADCSAVDGVWSLTTVRAVHDR